MTDPTTTIETTAEELEDAASEAASATDDAAGAVEDTATGKRSVPTWAPIAGAAVAGVAIAAPLLRMARTSHVALRPGEEIAMKIRPRRGFLRYLATLGLWEARRRATRVIVTDQRLLLEDGYLRRVVGSVPLESVRGVVLRTSVWEAFVNIQTATPRGGKSPEIEIGPLSKRTAVELAAAVSPSGKKIEVV